jgi:hypothetical protein
VAVGESVVVNVTVDKSLNLIDLPAALTADGGVAVETAAVRMPVAGQIAWRVGGRQPGDHTLTIKVGDHSATKRFVVGDSSRLHRLSPLRHDGGFWNGLLEPGEPRHAGKITSIEVKYPDEKMRVFGWRVHWLIVYFVLSILFGLSMKGVFKVDI